MSSIKPEVELFHMPLGGTIRLTEPPPWPHDVTITHDNGTTTVIPRSIVEAWEAGEPVDPGLQARALAALLRMAVVR